MRTLAVLAVIALAFIAAIIHYSDRDFGLTPGKIEFSTPAKTAVSSSTAGTREDFSGVANSLAGDMKGVPLSLDAPEVTPRAAFNVKSRLAAVVFSRREYQTLVRACDLIIYADQEHAVRRSQARQSRQNVSGDLMANAGTNQLQNAAGRTSVQTRAQADWEAYRRQTEQEVSRLLGSLPSPNR